ncbi:MAG: sugar phosphate isomerase/epimerase family protein [Planctomycetota bacterium]|jgi:inosose dehydratase
MMKNVEQEKGKKLIVGCFALIEPFRSIADQFRLIREMGIEYADLTDNHNGGMLGVEYGFTASVSLDIHPAKIREMAESNGITLTSVCAHANLLDPPSPDIYGTNEIIKAIKLAHFLGIKHVITTEGDPKTEFGHSLSEKEQLFTICEKLYAPVRWAEELGVELLLETHGVVTDSVERMGQLLDALGHEQAVGLCLDTGNSWLGGAEPLDYVKTFGKRIKHVHWKDMAAEWEDRRGEIYGCGMATIPLGDGVVDIKAIVKALKDIGFAGATTLEVAGAENVKLSLKRLYEWSG